MYFTHVEISESAIRHNLQLFREIIGVRKLAAVIKSNAYGHGIELIARLALKHGADLLAVNSIDEVYTLRKILPSATILVMGEVWNLREHEALLSDNNLWVVVSRVDQVEYLSGLAIRPKIHLKTDTGMGRLGHADESLFAILQELHDKQFPLDGIMTHFASTEDFTEHSYSMKQLDKFLNFVSFAETLGYTHLIKHAASSASTLLFEEARLDMVRIGISLYGFWPSEQTKYSYTQFEKTALLLQPVLGWKTQIVHIQTVKKGSFIGYGSTYRMNADGKIAVIPVGYHEGWNRRLSNQGYVLIGGERALVIGRVCMNMTIIDVSHIDFVSIGEEVTLIGNSKDEYLSADLLAEQAGTINYDIVTSIHPKFHRVCV
jgi:alanine racemase